MNEEQNQSRAPWITERLALRPAEAAELLGVSIRTLRQWMRDEELPFARLNGVVLIPCGRLESWLSQRAEHESLHDERVGEFVREALADIQTQT